VSSIFDLPGISDLVKREERNKVYGVLCAVVTRIDDDKGRYMVRVRFMTQPNGASSAQTKEESAWCRIVTWGAGKDRGWYGLPEVGDEVLVGFEQGDFNRPVILGSLWNKEQVVIDDNKDGKNDQRWYKSRSGHMLKFGDDTDGKKEQITIQSAKGAQIVIDDTDSGHRVHFQDQKKENYLTLDKQAKTVTLESTTGDIIIKAKEKILLEANNIEIVSKENTSMTAKQWLVDVGDKFAIQGKAAGDVLASDTLTLIGTSKVNIN
jgi:uncharacterized protein involved in type VI secretion and phage assembly